MGAPTGGTSTAQQSNRGHCQQTGQDRLGRAVQRQRVSAPAAGGSGLSLAVEKTLRLESTKRFPLFHRHDDYEVLGKHFHQGLLRTTKDETTVERRAGKPDSAIGRH